MVQGHSQTVSKMTKDLGMHTLKKDTFKFQTLRHLETFKLKDLKLFQTYRQIQLHLQETGKCIHL